MGGKPHVIFFSLVAKIEDNVSQDDDNLQATQSSEDCNPDGIIKDAKDCLEHQLEESDSNESTLVQAEVVFETVPAIVDPDSSEGIILDSICSAFY